MPHINNEPGQHDQTVSAYIIKSDGKKSRLMLHHHKIINRYLQFGGHIELDENPWQAISHEISEETGYDISQLRVLQPKIRLRRLSDVALHPMPVSYLTHRFDSSDHYHTDIAFGFITSDEPNHEVGDNESREIKLFSLEQLREIKPEDIYEDVREIGVFVLTEVLKNWDQEPTSDFS